MFPFFFTLSVPPNQQIVCDCMAIMGAQADRKHVTVGKWCTTLLKAHKPILKWTPTVKNIEAETKRNETRSEDWHFSKYRRRACGLDRKSTRLNSVTESHNPAAYSHNPIIDSSIPQPSDHHDPHLNLKHKCWCPSQTLISINPHPPPCRSL